MHRILLAIAALAGLTAVALAALAAHALPHWIDPARMAMVDQALALQGWNAAALLGAALWARQARLVVRIGAGLLALGLVLFCAGVYALALGGVRLPLVAPTGGTILMAGWLVLGVAAFGE